MLVLKILLLAVGAAFLLFGYLIFFKKRYSLINGFEADRKEGRKTERYAERVGLAELIAGVFFFSAGILLVLFA